MNYLIWTVSLIGILSTAVVCGTDMFFLTVGRPALRLASPSVGTEVMGFIHLFGDARMPVWGISAILSNFVLALFSGSGHRGFYFASLSMLILFVVIYNRLSKPINRLQTEASKTGGRLDNARRAAGVVGSIGDDPYSPARCVPARPVRSTASHFGVNAPVCSRFKSKERRTLTICGFMACRPTCGLFPTLRLFPDNGQHRSYCWDEDQRVQI